MHHSIFEHTLLLFPLEWLHKCIIVFDRRISEMDICYVFYESEYITDDLFSANCILDYRICFPRDCYFRAISDNCFYTLGNRQ